MCKLRVEANTSPLSPSMEKLKGSVIKEFERLKDPRIKREPKHLLIDVDCGDLLNINV